ncbi:putative DNA-binding protein (MmcQ/YjbR family) [Granulicella aggregans]|uniref:Putative DNA-binding protein (MmcQ/YjbR family) n=1 Tax=Granulicella aggregans TaxID=474949 RepID=A0A7W7ZER0_9BACT|nr:MmcQ/YjbR family DNA-binding protein [Granulicella aggregans]MBB5058590.1 putative DNA-binding protein (MmcQ/YjbR family) [Granulicella aggregans]
MDADQVRKFLLTLPHVVETMQWGDNLVYWVGDKAVGGKMFVLVNLDNLLSHGVMSYSAGPDRYSDLLEIEGLYPAPYMARIHWVAAERWDVFRNAEWQDELRAAHAITYAKHPDEVKSTLNLPVAQLKRLVAENTAIRAKKQKPRRQRRPQRNPRRRVP